MHDLQMFIYSGTKYKCTIYRRSIKIRNKENMEKTKIKVRLSGKGDCNLTAHGPKCNASWGCVNAARIRLGCGYATLHWSSPLKRSAKDIETGSNWKEALQCNVSVSFHVGFAWKHWPKIPGWTLYLIIVFIISFPSFPGFHVKKRLAWFSVVNSWLCTQRNFGCRSEMVHFAFNNVQHQIQNFLNLVNIVIPSSSKLKKWNTPKLDNRYPLWQRPNANFRAEKTFATTSVSLKRLGGCLVRQKLSSWERQTLWHTATLSGNFVQFVLELPFSWVRRTRAALLLNPTDVAESLRLDVLICLVICFL